MSENPVETPKRKIDPSEIAIGAAAVLLLWFGIQNSASVPVHFWVTSVSAPLIVVIACAAILGGLIVALWHRVRSRLKKPGPR